MSNEVFDLMMFGQILTVAEQTRIRRTARKAGAATSFEPMTD